MESISGKDEIEFKNIVDMYYLLLGRYYKLSFNYCYL